jgi:exopolysaccharide biosynthesis protein
MLDCPGLRLFASEPAVMGRTTSEFAESTRATVAINGDYFGRDGVPKGLFIFNGVQRPGTQDRADRSFLACSSSNACTIDPPNHRAGTRPEWQWAVGGMQPWVNGAFACQNGRDPECRNGNAGTPNPRTAVGLDDPGRELYFVVVDGRLPDFPGMTLLELGEVFRRLRIARGLNMDGGGSSTLVIKGRRVSVLPQNQAGERRVANHIGIRVE